MSFVSFFLPPALFTRRCADENPPCLTVPDGACLPCSCLWPPAGGFPHPLGCIPFSALINHLTPPALCPRQASRPGPGAMCNLPTCNVPAPHPGPMPVQPRPCSTSNFQPPTSAVPTFPGFSPSRLLASPIPPPPSARLLPFASCLGRLPHTDPIAAGPLAAIHQLVGSTHGRLGGIGRPKQGRPDRNRDAQMGRW